MPFGGTSADAAVSSGANLLCSLLQFRHTDQLSEIAPELTGHGLPLIKCEAYNRVYDQLYGSN